MPKLTTRTDLPPRQIGIEILAAPVTQTGTSQYVHNTVFPGAAIRQISNVQNDSISYDVALPAGTWRFELLFYGNTNIGIFTVTIAGASLTSLGGSADTIDGYAGSGTPTLTAVTGIVIPSDGVRRVAITMATKNASSSAYFGQINRAFFTRTA